jgi:hypothetical protein
MARDYSSNYTEIITEYINHYGEDISDTKLAKKILRENKDIDLKPNSMRLAIGSVRKKNNNKGVRDACNELGAPISSTPMIWLKSKGASALVKNPEYEPRTFIKQVEESFDDLMAKYDKRDYRKIKHEKLKDKKAIKITTSDDHVGLNPNPDDNALYQYEYNADTYIDSMDKVFNSTLKEFNTHGKFDMLLLDNLGDEQDGWNGQTTRGGHELPQNMTNAEVFDVCVDTKVNMIVNLVESNVANKIILRKVVNDNHSGDFGLIVNKAVEKIINRIYSTDVVKIEHLTRFFTARMLNKCLKDFR